ncbi:uncharacterized protein [Littorina saxatilis]|uniref:Uncharacterized protein n=1 Tax=Littorina saxatilis TaxID=31220 RepID=A0AAN9BIY2_9CAEN
MARFTTTAKSRPQRKILLFALFILVTFAGASQNCAHFRFPFRIQHGEVSMAEHSTINLFFALDTSKCPQDVDKAYFIYVAQGTSKYSSGVDYCAVRLSDKDADCFSYKTQNCGCTKQTDGWKILFRKNVTRSDNGPWTWQTGDGLSKTIVFDIQSDTKKNNNPSESPAEEKGTRKKKKNPIAKAPLQVGRSSEETPPAVNDDNKGARKEDTHLLRNKEKALVIHDIDSSDKDNTRDSIPDTEISGKDNSDEAESSAKNDVNVVKDDDDAVTSSVTTGVVVGTLIAVSIVVVLVVVVMCRRRKEIKARRCPPAELPPPSPRVPDYAVVGRPRPEVPRESYVSVASVTSETYDVIPVACHSFENDTYLVPVVTHQTCKENLYEPLV